MKYELHFHNLKWAKGNLNFSWFGYRKIVRDNYAHHFWTIFGFVVHLIKIDRK